MPLKHEDWFSSRKGLFTKYLDKYNSKKINVLEIGVFEGRSSLWFLNNILKHKDSKIYCVDTWKYGSKKYQDVYSNFKENMEPFKDKVVILRGKSSEMIKRLTDEKFDFIYIDGDHHSKSVLEDAVLYYRHLKPGGLMIFDDYTHNKDHDVNCPRPGIDAFLNIYSNEIKVLYLGWVVIVKKRVKALEIRPCYSEFYKEPKTVPEIYTKPYKKKNV